MDPSINAIKPKSSSPLAQFLCIFPIILIFGSMIAWPFDLHLGLFFAAAIILDFLVAVFLAIIGVV